MSGSSIPNPFSSGREQALEAPRPIVPTPANMVGQLRGRRVLVGLPGHGWRGDLRADEKVVQGSRTYVPVLPEAEWYRAESEQTEVFAALVPIERVWIEEFGISGTTPSGPRASQTVSLDEPPRRPPVQAFNADTLTGRRIIELGDGEERRDLRAVTEPHLSEGGDICVRVASELEWYSWGWSGKSPRTRELPIDLVWVE